MGVSLWDGRRRHATPLPFDPGGRPDPLPPAPPSAPVLSLPLGPIDCAYQALDGLLHLFPNHVADHSDQTLPSWHPTLLPPTLSTSPMQRMVAVELLANSSPSPSKATAVLGR